MAQLTVEVPEPGLYPDVPADVYHRWPAANQTVLKIMRDRSPAHARQYMLTPPEPTPAMVLGQAIHAAILQPDLFREHYVRGPEFDRRTKQGREAWEALAAEHPNAIILKPEDYDRCIAIRDAVHSHHYARKLLRGQTEVSAVWRDPWFGVLCKGRFDCVPTGLGIIVDVKSVSDASPRAMQRFIYAYGTYLQAAHYMIGAKQLGVDADYFVLIAVEKEPPYGIGIYNIRGDALMAGEEELAKLLRTWSECETEGQWPGYSELAVDVTLPSWAFNQIEMGLEGEA